jgi:hypothetical protein
MEKLILTELCESFAKETTVFTYALLCVCTKGFCGSAVFDNCGRFCFDIPTADDETGKAFVTTRSAVIWLVATAVPFCADIFLVYSIGVSPEVGEGDFFFLVTVVLSNCGCDLSAFSVEMTEILGVSAAMELGSACCCVKA